MNEERFRDDLHAISDKILNMISEGKEIAVITHTDADGIIAGSIIAKMLLRKDARFVTRTISDMNADIIKRLRDERHQFYIICDLGAGFVNLLESLDSWIVIDHHQLPEEEFKDERVLNAWKYGINGGIEICAGGMAYMVAKTIDDRNKDLSSLAVVAAVADRQDQGDKKSLIGINTEIANTARSLGLLSIDLDLMLVGRETRPLHESLASTSFPYIEGLTWNSDSCLSLLNNAGLKLKDDGRWRVLAEFNEEEKRIIIETISRFVASTSKASNVVEDLIGYIYTLSREDNRSMLRDAREFSTLLNACARIGKAGVGMAICLGDRNSMLKEGERIVSDYRSTLRNYINTIFSERWRIQDDGRIVMINGEGLLAEDMLGAVSSLLSGSPSMHGKVIFVRTRAKDGSYKFSSRKALQCNAKVNLGLLMRECSSRCNGNGGGHDPAAGARVPKDNIEKFLACLREGTDAA